MTSLRSSVLFFALLSAFSAFGSEPETEDETSREAALFEMAKVRMPNPERPRFGESQTPETKEAASKGQIETSQSVHPRYRKSTESAG